MRKDRVIVIVGPTASGKTGVGIRTALEIERRFGCAVEIISADSRAVYKYMDIGTAKPTMAEMQGVKHWGLDLVEPGERWTVADWKAYAEKKIAEIQERGSVPMVVGGAGLYIDSLVFNYQFSGGAEQKNCSDRTEMDDRFRVFGVSTETEQLRENIYSRVNKMFTQELFSEVKFLVQKYGWGSQAMKSDIYEYAWKYLEGEISLEEAKKLCFYEDWHLAKRQMTWFKRNEKIIWIPLEKITQSVLECIQNE
ncbi:MAG: tRNA (adenosine(37)-N6)-dimethylallyltransferase MiaA [Candidatus Saccharibacteria bacterium]|nr:tRNA (adenosine(37)-N6)-dimethylallyltransferase MiaA [Candidatus Saccharibacteria bacterium]